MRFVAAAFVSLLLASGPVFAAVDDRHDDCSAKENSTSHVCARVDLADGTPTSPMNMGKHLYLYYDADSKAEKTSHVSSQAPGMGSGLPTFMPVLYADTNGYDGLQVRGKFIGGSPVGPDQSVLG